MNFKKSGKNHTNVTFDALFILRNKKMRIIWRDFFFADITNVLEPGDPKGQRRPGGELRSQSHLAKCVPLAHLLETPNPQHSSRNI